MKKILVLFMILTTYIFSQGWNDIVTTSISESNMTKMDLFTNKDGNHVITQNTNSSNSIKYYLLKSNGDTLRSSIIETGGNAQFPNISGDNNKVYLVYKLGSNLKVTYTTNAGQGWNDLTPKAIGSNTCNGVDIVNDSRGLHVVYALKDSDPDYETHYYKLNSSNAWVDYQNVTDGAEVGGFPTVSVSTNRVHVGYNTGNELNPMLNQGTAKSRDKNGSSWETPQSIFATTSAIERIHAGSSKLFSFYYKLEAGVFKLCAKKRDFSSTTWSVDTVLQTGSDVYDIVSATTTSDGKTHIVYSGTSNNEVYRNYNGSYWSTEYSFGYPNNAEIPVISSAGNDLFISLRNAYHSGIQYCQYDATPAAPPNFAGTTQNNHPKITWSAVNEPDVYSGGHIKVFRGYQDGSVTYYMLAATIAGDSTNWVDDAVTLVNPKLPHTTYLYKVSAVDLGSKESAATTPVQYSGTGIMWKISGGESSEETIISEFKLSQNYPNPFNPSTEINYQIPAKGFVTLKVYDMLGKEVAVLVNEWQEVGSYNAQFTTSGKQLASGMYFYTLNAGKFTDTKKLILLK